MLRRWDFCWYENSRTGFFEEMTKAGKKSDSAVFRISLERQQRKKIPLTEMIRAPTIDGISNLIIIIIIITGIFKVA